MRAKGSGKPVDIEKLEKYARIGATQQEMSRCLGVSPATLERRLQQPKFREALDKGQADLYTSLRTKQVQLALAGNVTMLIWLGKQYLGQKDKQEHTGADGGPIEHKHEIVLVE